MAAKLPYKARLWGYTTLAYIKIPIYICPHLEAMGMAVTGADCPGDAGMAVLVWEKQNPAMFDDTLIHEFLHCITYLRELGWGDWNEETDAPFKRGHHHVQIVATDLAQMLRTLELVEGDEGAESVAPDRKRRRKPKALRSEAGEGPAGDLETGTQGDATPDLAGNEGPGIEHVKNLKRRGKKKS